jgi:hypothetical protein
VETIKKKSYLILQESVWSTGNKTSVSQKHNHDNDVIKFNIVVGMLQAPFGGP